MKKKLLTLTALLAILLISFAGIEQQDKKFKNLKVLSKKITYEELDHIMDNFNYSLGVKCNYCHARNDSTKHLDFASDAKPEKETARRMMKMTASINKKYFNFDKHSTAAEVVTCITCHRKNPIPLTDTMPARKRG